MKKNIHIILASVLFAAVLWVSVSLSNEFYSTMEIPVKLVNFPSGYTSGTNLPENVSIKLRGNGWKLLAVNMSARPEYIISANNDSGRQMVNLYNYLIENQWLSSDMEVIDISPDTLSFYVERTTTKKVKVVADLELNFKPGFGLAAPLELRPDSVYVTGPVSYLNSITSIPTENLEINELDSRTVENASIKQIPGMQYESGSVAVLLDVQKIVDKDYNDLTVEILDIPVDRDVVLLPNKINIGLRGGVDVLGRIGTGDARAYVNYRDVVLDTLGSVVPKIEIPGNTKLVYIKPERLRYIIKKFN